MQLNEVLRGVACCHDLPQDVEISDICYDTRNITKGALFVALSGYLTDGHRFIDDALSLGAVAVLCQRPPQGDGPWIVAENSRMALAQISANWYDHPAQKLQIIGVTGTNGKTTTTFLLKGMLEGTIGAKVGLIGTNQIMMGEEVRPAHRTTPESWEIHGLLREMADKGCTHVVMEVSSHALIFHRVHGIHFAAAIFTNLTQDHLDFHGTMEAYQQAKGRLFAQSEVAILNLDDESGRYYSEHVSCPKFTYSENKDEGDLTAKNIRLFPTRVEFEGVTQGGICRVKLPIPGGFSIYNALGVLACGLALGIPLEPMTKALATAQGVKGRLEVVPVPTDYTVIIDYAHTPDALENVLTAVGDFTQGRLFCLFGCGGDRDRSKRKIMGSVVAELADVAIVTSDNPRTENPDDIITDILDGMEVVGGTVTVIPDRREAIRYVLAQMRAGDVVVLAGKGHETYQEICGVQHHLDEREEVARFFQMER